DELRNRSDIAGRRHVDLAALKRDEELAGAAIARYPLDIPAEESAAAGCHVHIRAKRSARRAHDDGRGILRVEPRLGIGVNDEGRAAAARAADESEGARVEVGLRLAVMGRVCL